MSVMEFLPDTRWRKHIAAYWVLQTNTDAESVGKRIYADGCADLICNAGDSIACFLPMAGSKQTISLHPGQLYLGGTMTAYGVLKADTKCLLTGIRFWPGGFYALFSKPIQPAVDSTIAFPHDELCKIMQSPENLHLRIEQWLSDQSAADLLPKPDKYDFTYLRRRMYESGGTTTVESLADEMHVSKRTLERIFKQNVGIPPKEFLRIIRFQEVLKRLHHTAFENGSILPKESLLGIAFDLGYYDHAHLTNEFKKYAGILPSELSHFYKTGISGGQYF